MKLQDKNFINDLKMDGTFNESSFDREYKQFVLYKSRELLGSPSGWSAAKLRQLPQKVQRLSYLGVGASVSKRETPIGDDIVWTI